MFTGIGVGSPERHGHGLKDAFITYRIKSTLDGEVFNVARRYSDFLDLSQALQKTMASVILPPLPEKQSITQLLGDRFSPQLIKQRQVGLGRWLRRVAARERIGKSAIFKEFMSNSVAPDYSDFSATTNADNSNIEESFSESQEALFSKAKEEIDLLNKHLKSLTKQSVTWNEHQKGIGVGFGDLALCFEQLANCIQLGEEIKSPPEGFESPEEECKLPEKSLLIKASFSRMSTSCAQASVQWDQLGEDSELDWELLLQELFGYLTAAQNAFNTRLHLKSEKSRLEKLLSELYSERESGQVTSPTSLILGKWDQLKGIDPITARQNRTARVDQRCDETRVQLGKVENSLESTNRLLLSEWSQVQQQVQEELQEGLLAFDRLRKNFYTNAREEWGSLIQWMNQPITGTLL